jgi:hypothetical protein
MQIKMDPKNTYKMDISVTVKNPDGVFDGMGHVGRKPLYTLQFDAEDKIDLLSFRTCSREFIINEPKTFMNRKRFIYNYTPNEIETAGSCPAMVSAFNEQGMFSGAYIDFLDESTTLPAHNVCGVVTEDTQGVSTCQERMGSIETISFETEVITSPDPGCEIESGNKGKKFTYKIKKGFCTYIFIEANKPYRLARHTTFGYDTVQYRR